MERSAAGTFRNLMILLVLAACSSPADFGQERRAGRGLSAPSAPQARPAEPRRGQADSALARPIRPDPTGEIDAGGKGDAGSGVADAAAGNEAGREVDAILALGGDHSTSTGSCRDGSLKGGVALPLLGPGFLHNPRRPREARFATAEVVQAIVRAARVVAEEMPGPSLVVNDLCLREGGPIAQHGSHQNGLDADILFYYLDRSGKPIRPVGVPLDPQGWGWDFKDLATAADDVRLRLDPRRTWRFIWALLERSEAAVQRIFIAEHLRTMLVEQARRSRAPREIRERFEQITCQPGTPHDDHMHVRFFCAPDDITAGCEDSHPIYPWRRQQLQALDVEPVVATYTRSQRKRARARTTTPAQARRRAGRMHRKVREFLDQRKSWQEKPSPGRPYCR